MKLSTLKYPVMATLSMLAVSAIYFNAGSISATTETFTISTQPIQICGGTYYELQVATSNNISIQYQSLRLPNTGELMMVPADVLDLREVKTNLNVVGSGQIALNANQKLLPLPRPISNNTGILDEYCRKVKQFQKRVTQSTGINISTNLLQMQLNGTSVQAVSKSVTIAAPAQTLLKTSNQLQPLPSSTIPIKHVVIYDPDYQAEAIALANYRTASGVKSVAINVTTLPGYNPSAAVPQDCQGDYYKECYLDLNGVDSVDMNSAQMLVGMRTGRNVGDPAPTKVVDVAGIIRAGLRKLKRENPLLSYVVLLGHPKVLPPRFTGVDDYESTYQLNANFTLPTDLYFSEIDLPWRLNDKTTSAAISALVFANGTNDGAGNNDWDTTHFIWPVSSPRARSMDFPIYFEGWTETVRSHMLAVGRITAKAAFGKDPQVASFVSKLAFYESHLLPLSNNIVATADGVYEYYHFNGIKNQLGDFWFWSENFGTGFVAPSQAGSYPAACNKPGNPATNTWTAMQGKSMYSFQNGTADCKPNDPAAAGRKLPNPNDIKARAQSSGFTFLFFEGHGGEVGVNLNSGAHGWEPSRGVYSPAVADSPAGNNLKVEQMSSSKAQGFVVASACSVGPFLGKKWSPFEWNHNKTLAESFITTPGVGTVGAYLNYSVGWFGSDPAYEMAFAAKVKAANKTGTNRIGDAIKELVIDNIKNVYVPDWATMNRFYHGDPATLIAKKPFNPNEPATYNLSSQY